LLRDGDKPGNFFSEVNKTIFSKMVKEGQRNHQDLCSVNRVRRRLRGEESKAPHQGKDGQVGQVHQDLRSVNCVRRRLCGEERKALQQGKDGQVGQVHQDHPSVNRARRQQGEEEGEKVELNATIKNSTV
jgi:hypothetical protein